MRYFLNLFILLLLSDNFSAQVTFSKIPKQLQLFPRDENNFGHFEVEGKSTVPATIRTVVSEVASGKLTETFSLQISPDKVFVINHKIQACLKEYNLEVFITDTSLVEQRVEFIRNLVAGDFFIVAGQSNANCMLTAGYQKHDSVFQNSFIRAIGGDFSWATALSGDSVHANVDLEVDFSFGRPSSLSNFSNDVAYSGIWPMSLQSELTNKTGIPNCVANGSRGAVGIPAHYASHTPSIPDSLQFSNGPKNIPPALLYDRMYKKLFINNATAGVKGIFWYQGESDGAVPYDSAIHYGRRFRKLYNSWKADYPSLKKIFVMQINLGCGGDHLSIVREIERKLPEEYNDVVVMSTVGSPLSDRYTDGCHYTVEGYTRIATKLLPLAEKYLYDFPLDEKLILPANVQKIYYSATNEICIEFDKDIIAQDSCFYAGPIRGTAYLKDYFYMQDGLKIKLNSLRSENNKVFLNLFADESFVKKITYLPGIFTDIPSIYGGPWILNKDNEELGAYSFFEFPVQQFDPKEKIMVYPNPAKNYLKINFKENEQGKIYIYNLYGDVLLTSDIESGQMILNTSALNSGIYLLVIRGYSTIFTSKLVIE